MPAPVARITTLIDKVDVIELVRDQIAGILDLEQQNQQVLADAAGKESRLWALRIFTEASNPWEQFKRPDLKKGEDVLDVTPIINVWIDQGETRAATTTQAGQKKVDGTFQIDCYGYGLSAADGDGQISGDTAAALEAQRAARLVRNILEAGQYINLGLQKTVGDRVIQTNKNMGTPQGGQNTQHVQGVRLTLLASFNEYSPQYEGQPFEAAHVTTTRDPQTGAVTVFDYSAST